MKILIAGAQGQLGCDCLAILARHELRGMDLPELDITDPASVTHALKDFRPDVVVNCAAFTRVDAAETEREAAWRVNADGPRHLARELTRRGGRLVHLSTDYVFDGRRPPPQPYVESDQPGPTGYYGVSKLAGETAVLEACGRHVILRTAWLYGRHGHNFLKTMLRLALRQPDRPLKVVNDQYGSPTWSERLARQIDKVVDAGVTGLYHATAEGYGTWFDLACHFLKAMGLEHEIRPCATAEHPTPARRPANSILENARLKAEGLNVMQDWRADLDAFVARFREDLLAEERARA